MSTELVVARGQQIVGLLLSTVPLAERMLLYNLALTAWIMLPERKASKICPVHRWTWGVDAARLLLTTWYRLPCWRCQARRAYPKPVVNPSSQSHAL